MTNNRIGKNVLFCVLYLTALAIPYLSAFERIPGDSFVGRNMNFCVYFFLFLSAIALFYSEIAYAVEGVTKDMLESLCNVGVIVLFANIAAAILLSKLQIENLNQNAIDSAADNTLLLKLTLVVTGPVVEELVYRYCIFSFFPAREILACSVSVLLFAFSHVADYVLIYGNFTQILGMAPYIALGIGFCVLYMRTKNICLPILLHSIINLIAVISM